MKKTKKRKWTPRVGMPVRWRGGLYVIAGTYGRKCTLEQRTADDRLDIYDDIPVRELHLPFQLRIVRSA